MGDFVKIVTGRKDMKLAFANVEVFHNEVIVTVKGGEKVSDEVLEEKGEKIVDPRQIKDRTGGRDACIDCANYTRS